MRECVFTHAGTSLGEEFEEAACSEEIEIDCVEASSGIDSLCLLARADPAIFDARQSLFVEIKGPFGERFFAQNLRVINSDRREDCGRNEQPPCGESVAMERPPGDKQRCDHNQKADISERAVHAFKVRDCGFAGVLPLPVFFCRSGGGG